ncbi:MAG: phosphoglycerate mutase family protein [Pseudomonadota bacterium]
MKIVSLLLLFAVGACAIDSTTPETVEAPTVTVHEIYLVRHAEKQTGDDPALTADGAARAETLAEILSEKALTHIHSTNLKRTLETAAPIAALMGIEVEVYDASDLAAFALQLQATPGVHLVVGHSNTTPSLAEALGGDPGTAIDEASEYDRLYVIDLSPEMSTSRIDRFGVRYQQASDDSD